MAKVCLSVGDDLSTETVLRLLQKNEAHWPQSALVHPIQCMHLPSIKIKYHFTHTKDIILLKIMLIN